MKILSRALMLSAVLGVSAKAVVIPPPITNGFVSITVSGVTGNYEDTFGHLTITTNTVLAMTINFNTNRLVLLGGGSYNDAKGTATFTIMAPGGTTNITTTNGVGITIATTNGTGNSTFSDVNFGNLNFKTNMYGGVSFPPNVVTDSEVKTGLRALACQSAPALDSSAQFQGPKGGSGLALGALITNVAVSAPDFGYPQPRLDIEPAGNNLILTWPTNAPHYRPQRSSALLGSWTELTNSITTNAHGKNQVILPLTASNACSIYRLVHP